MTFTKAIENEVVLYRDNRLANFLPDHGFAGIGSEEYLQRKYPKLPLIRLLQKHTAKIKDFRTEDSLENYCTSAETEPADGMVLSLPMVPAPEPSKICTIVTADCLPVMLWNDLYIALVHAGWRGVASGILEEAISKMGIPTNVAIGPAAGGDCYEVGEEVINAIGTDAVAVPIGEKFLLNLPASAKAKILAVAPNTNIETVSVCTMSDTSFHSYRREAEGRGRNYSFILL